MHFGVKLNYLRSDPAARRVFLCLGFSLTSTVRVQKSLPDSLSDTALGQVQIIYAAECTYHQ